MARNIAQKRTIFGDPLCKVVWKRTYQAEHNPAQVRALEEKVERAKS
jgi:hypothetical protein